MTKNKIENLENHVAHLENEISNLRKAALLEDKLRADIERLNASLSNNQTTNEDFDLAKSLILTDISALRWTNSNWQERNQLRKQFLVMSKKTEQKEVFDKKYKLDILVSDYIDGILLIQNLLKNLNDELLPKYETFGEVLNQELTSLLNKRSEIEIEAHINVKRSFLKILQADPSSLSDQIVLASIQLLYEKHLLIHVSSGALKSKKLISVFSDTVHQ